MHALLILPLALGALAGTPATNSSEEIAQRDLEGLAAEARLRSFLALAELDEQELATLAGLADRVAMHRDRYLDQRRTVLNHQRAAFISFRAEDLDGGDFTPGVQKDTWKAEQLGIVSSREFVHSLTVIDELAAESLDPGTLLLLDVLQPEDFARCALCAKERAPGKPLERQAWGALEAVGGLKGKQLSSKARAEAERLLEIAAREGVPAGNPDAELRRIVALLERAGSIPERAVERCRDHLARAIRPRTRSDQARVELRAIHTAKQPLPSTLVRLLLAEGASDLLRGGELDQPSPGEREVRDGEAEVARLRNEINLLNLMNGLHLSRAQLASLREIGERAYEVRCKVAERRPNPSAFASLGFTPLPLEPTEREGGRSQLGKEIKHLRSETGRGRLPAETGVRVVQILAAFAPAERPMLPKECRVEYGAEVLEVLTPAQRRVLLDFSPCLIPPKELRDPVRVGEAGGDEEALRVLDEIRAFDDEDYATLRAELAEKNLARLEAHEGRWPEPERRRVLGEMEQLLDDVRGLDAAAFAVRSPEFVERLLGLQLKTAMKKRVDVDVEHELNRRANVFLLDPCVAGLARQMGERRDARGVPDPVDLEKITPADSCKDGECAVD